MQFEYDLIAFGHKEYIKRYKAFLKTVQVHKNIERMRSATLQKKIKNQVIMRTYEI